MWKKYSSHRKNGDQGRLSIRRSISNLYNTAKVHRLATCWRWLKTTMLWIEMVVIYQSRRHYLFRKMNRGSRIINLLALPYHFEDDTFVWISGHVQKFRQKYCTQNVQSCQKDCVLGLRFSFWWAEMRELDPVGLLVSKKRVSDLVGLLGMHPIEDQAVLAAHVRQPNTPGFAQTWKVLEYTGLSWKVLENKIGLEEYLKNTQRPWKVLEF